MGWQTFNDMFVTAAAPLGFGNPVGYVFAQYTQHIIYVGFAEGQGPDGQIWELYWNVNVDDTKWHPNRLTATSGAHLAFQDNIKAYIQTSSGTQHVVYLGLDDQGVLDSHVHELYWDGNWNANDLTNAAGGARLALSTPTGYEFRNLEHVVYQGIDSHIYELWRDSNGWHHNDLTNAPVVSLGPVTAHVFELLPSQHIVYRSLPGRGPAHIKELHWDNNGWQTSDLTQDAHAPLTGDVQITDYTFEEQGTQHVNYLGQDGHINELVWNYDNGWLVNDLTLADPATLKQGGAPLGGRAFGYVFRPDGTQHVVYAGTDGHIYELSKDASGWHLLDLTMETGGAPLAAGDPIGYEFTPNVGQGTRHVIYTSVDHHLIELKWVAD